MGDKILIRTLNKPSVILVATGIAFIIAMSAVPFMGRDFLPPLTKVQQP